MIPPPPAFYEFFAGAGMARAGLGQHWRCLFANDIDRKKAAAYCLNWGTDGYLRGDVRDVTAEDLPGRADLAWASFPCQDLSLAGCGAGLQGERSGTFRPFQRLMLELGRQRRAPTLLVLEMVGRIRSAVRENRFFRSCRGRSSRRFLACAGRDRKTARHDERGQSGESAQGQVDGAPHRGHGVQAYTARHGGIWDDLET